MENAANYNHLINIIVTNGLLSNKEAQTAAQESMIKQQPFVSYLVEKKLINSSVVAKICSDQFSMPLFDLSTFDITQIPTNLLNEKRVIDHSALPLFIRNNKLYIAVSDPSNNDALDEFQFNAGMNTEAILVDEKQLQQTIKRVFEKDASELSMRLFDEQTLMDIKLSDEINTIHQANDDDQPIVIYVDKLLMDAINKGASDLHFEPYEKTYRIRFRIDGILHKMETPPTFLSSRLAARLKVMSKMDIAERRIPQDGRIKFNISETKSIDFRVSSLPTLFGEKIVLRILDSSIAMMGIDTLGYEDKQRVLFEEHLQRSQGMILVTGPTGSGKTVSLYTGLTILNTPERNISTAEDPVEINLPGINQVHINNKAGLDFSSALRAFLRQDPDVVMVGEIRDLETAEIAMKASQTGHLVLSTLHTNSAAETITRLMNMGISGYNIASSVSLIIAQRLVRRLCEHCKVPEHIPSQQLVNLGFKKKDLASYPTLYCAKGCNKCSGGYNGRIGIYETMPISETIGRAIMTRGNSLEIAEIAQQEGINNLYQSGLLKVSKGITSLAEINRVINVTSNCY